MIMFRAFRCDEVAVAARVRRGMLAVITLATSLFATESMSAQSPGVVQSAADRGFASSALHPGDVLRVRIYREPDLSGEFTIDENGIVTLPKLGPIRAVDEPVAALKARLISSFAAYVTQAVEVTPVIRVRVLGAVRSPGIYKVEPAMTLNDAIALAGGPTSAGRTDRVNLIRNGRAVDALVTPNAALAESPLQSGDQLFVPQRSWISRNPGMVYGAVSAVATIVWAFRR
jgi:protein involved in polysaccharide export with SLBB domain